MFMKKAVVLFVFIAMAFTAMAQNDIKAVLVDGSTGEFVGFATVSITKDGQTKPTKFVLSSDEGKVLLESVRNGSYTLKAELMGYKPYEKVIKMDGKPIDLGEVKMVPDAEQLAAAEVSAVGNPIVIKKDTVEYNASSFKTTENDVLEDLLKKLPGVEVDDNGTITANGEEITKIMIDGKTFFLDDPSVASKNLPARIINKIKVVQRKSEQARFTGIDDGEEEHVIDLSVKPGMMKGLMGDFQGGGGHDIPSERNTNDEFRYQGNGFIGRFVDGSHIGIILNANNTNNRGSGDRSGNMMGGMMGGGMMGAGGFGRGGIVTSYMAGANAAGNLFDDKMDLGGHYMMNHFDRDIKDQTYRRNYLEDHNLITESDGLSNQVSGGHSFGLRMEHKFSDNTSIVFQPQLHFGSGNYFQKSATTTDYDPLDAAQYKLNEADVDNTGANKNLSTSGMFIFRQRLGKAGRTMTAMTRYSFSNNDLTGTNYNRTKTFDESGDQSDDVIVDQFFNSNQKSSSIFVRATYTEPIVGHFFLEANYAYNWSRSSSDKATFNTADGMQDYSYSNNVVNINSRHEIGGNLMYQKEKLRAQLGFSAQPTHTYNSTTQYDPSTGSYSPREYADDRWNWSPQAMMFGDINEKTNIRFFYRGRSSQPSTSQLMPVPDNTNPLRVSFGNPSLTPYFSHNANMDFRFSDKEKFTSLYIRFNGNLTQNPISNAIWYSAAGAQYSMPFNGHNSGRLGANMFFNSPIAKSNFSINNNIGFNWNNSSSYVGTHVNMEGYPDPLKDYYAFMERFIADRPNLDNASDFECNTTNSMNIHERFRAIYRTDALEVSLGGRARVNLSRYSLNPEENLTTWSNQATAGVIWTWDATGLSFKSDYRYNWYVGYKTDMPDEHILNAEITKLLFKKKVTLSARCWDILAQSSNMFVQDTDNYYSETSNNTLGRYIIISLAYRFGNFGGPGGPGGNGPGGPMMGPRRW